MPVSTTLSALRPTGDAILYQRDAAPATLAQGFETSWLASGTAALATSLLLAKHDRDIAVPEVILPTYGCPDLVAAASYAGVRAVLVDIQPGSPHYDYEQLRQAINSNTVAIVTATLLGIRGDEKVLREIIGDRAIMLIEDSAQWFPRNPQKGFFGDAVVVSFGRGKPVNLLGGGALLTRTALPAGVRQRIAASDAQSPSAQLKYRAKIAAYNALIRPDVYGVVEKAPFLNIGATEFHALPHIAAIPAPNHALLGSNLRLFTDRSLITQTAWKTALENAGIADVIDLAATQAVPADYSLLRYPLLVASAARREKIYAALKAQGLGASIMYPQALHDIAGVRERATLFAGQNNAVRFSQQLLTLPTHTAVTQNTIAATLTIMQSQNDSR